MEAIRSNVLSVARAFFNYPANLARRLKCYRVLGTLDLGNKPNKHRGSLLCLLLVLAWFDQLCFYVFLFGIDHVSFPP
jgi:hypothetical protein